MATNLDNINYIKDQFSLSPMKHWYIYPINKYKIYQYINSDTNDRILIPINYKINFTKNLTFLYSEDNLKLKTSDGDILDSFS